MYNIKQLTFYGLEVIVMYSIRYASIKDAPILGEIHSSSWKVAYKDLVPDEVLDNMTAEKRTRFFEKSLFEGWEEDAIIFKDEIPLGFICLGKCRDKDMDSSFGEIWGLYLAPEYYHKGIGQVIMNWGLEELKNRGYSNVSLWVFEKNLSARTFYEKMGFYFDGTVNELNIGGKLLNEVRYRRTNEN